MASEDLLAYLKLEAEVFNDYTVHPSYRRNRSRGAIEKVETRWIRTKSLGEGAFGQVWHEQTCSSNNDQKVRAVKVIRKQRMRQLRVDYKKELLALATFSKEEYRQADVLVSFLNWFETDESVFLAMEYFRYGDLATHMHSISSEDEVRQITIDLLQGLKIMHSERFTHRDLKPQNIFVAEKPPDSARWWVKIGDFGISKRVNNEETALRTQIGTPYFQAPEILGFVSHNEESYEYDESVDAWSLGCVVYNVSAQQVPFAKMSDINKFCQKRSQLSTAPLSRILSEAGIGFIQRLLIPEPAQRMTVEQALQEPWILNPTPSLATQHKPIMVFSPQIARPNTTTTSVVARSEPDPFPQDTLRTIDYRSEFESDWVPRTSHTVGIQIDRASTDMTQKRTTIKAARATDSKAHESSVPCVRPGKSVYHNPATTSKSLLEDTQQQALSILASRPAGMPTESPNPILDLVTESSEPASRPNIDWNNTIKLRGQRGRVRSLAFSPDSTMLASGSSDKEVRLWHAKTGQLLCKLSGPRAQVNSVAFSPDGTILAAGSRDTNIRLWDVASRRLLYTLYMTRVVCAVTFSPDGKLLVSGTRGNDNIRLWDVATGQIHRELFSYSDATSVSSLAFSPDGALLASSSSERYFQIWDIGTGEVQRKQANDDSVIHDIAFSLDGKILALALSGPKINLWDIAAEKVQRSIYENLGRADQGASPDAVTNVTFSPDGTLLLSGGTHDKVMLHDVASGKVHQELPGPGGFTRAVAYSPDGTVIAATYLRTLESHPTGHTKAESSIQLWGAVTDLHSINGGWQTQVKRHDRRLQEEQKRAE